jgi:hypothetical protein
MRWDSSVIRSPLQASYELQPIIFGRIIVRKYESNSSWWSTARSATRTAARPIQNSQFFLETIWATVSDPIKGNHLLAQGTGAGSHTNSGWWSYKSDGTKYLLTTLGSHQATVHASYGMYDVVRGESHGLSSNAVLRCTGNAPDLNRLTITRRRYMLLQASDGSIETRNSGLNWHWKCLDMIENWCLQVRTVPCISVPSSRPHAVQGQPGLRAGAISQTSRTSRRQN